MASSNDTAGEVFGAVRALLELIGAVFLAGLGAVSLISGAGLKHTFRSSAAGRGHRETVRLYREVKASFDASRYADPTGEAADDFMLAVLSEACERAEVYPSDALGDAVIDTTRELLLSDCVMYGWPSDEFVDRFLAGELSLEEGAIMANLLRRKQRFLADSERLEGIWREKIIRIFEGNLAYLPKSAIEHEDNDRAEDYAEASDATLEVMLTDLLSECQSALNFDP